MITLVLAKATETLNLFLGAELPAACDLKKERITADRFIFKPKVYRGVTFDKE